LNANARHGGKQRKRLLLPLLLPVILMMLLAPRPQTRGGLGNIRGKEKLDLDGGMKKLYGPSLGASNSRSHQG